MESPDTLYQVISQLRQRGYTEDLNRHDNNMVWLNPDAYQVDAIYRFERPTNPDETGPPTRSILYALSSERYGVKGVLVNGYGLSADAVTAGTPERALEQRLHRWPVA